MPLTVGIHAIVELIASLSFMLCVNLELVLLFVNLVGYVRMCGLGTYGPFVCELLLHMYACVDFRWIYIACWIYILLHIYC
uniref:Uncharacterized protein n=1 Tax=Triticum urartu TaxID=4572 RepID=A0A8R7QMZ6_TRIUA